MRNRLDDLRIDVICGDCGTAHCRRIGYFRKHTSLTCAACGTEIMFHNKQLQASIIEFDRTMTRLRRSWLH
jgi:hypothetical protein